MVVYMELGLIIFATAFLILDLLASRFGVDSRDGSDWMPHDDRAPQPVGAGR